jgi:hypothetical protein
MASAELAVKRCIGVLVPDAEWLATHLPTPPLIRILAEFLPRLPARCLIGDKVVPPPPAIMQVLKKGITIRNDATHAGIATPTGDQVEEILVAVEDLLWLLDYYTGEEWALGYVRAETRTALEELAVG